MTSVRKCALGFAICGLIIPILILLAKAFSAAGFSPVWIFYVWPSYFMLGGLAGPVDATTITYVVVSILVNVLLFGIVGGAVGHALSGKNH